MRPREALPARSSRPSRREGKASIARLTWVLKDEHGSEKDYQHFDPPLILAVDQVFAKIRNLTYRYLPNASLFPEELTQHDPWVIREFPTYVVCAWLGNTPAVAHKHYLTVTTAGLRLFNGLTPAEQREFLRQAIDGRRATQALTSGNARDARYR